MALFDDDDELVIPGTEPDGEDDDDADDGWDEDESDDE